MILSKSPYTERRDCRSCHSSSLQAILSLGNLYVSGFVNSPADTQRCARAPLELVLCSNCTLLQLRHSVNPELLYRQYWYRSMINDSMRTALAEIAHLAEALAELKRGDVVLDIGCNDGTLLRSYGTQGLQLVGFEPAGNLLDESQKGTTRIFNDFFSAEPFLQHSAQKAKVITSIAMFYDLESPGQFVSDVVRCLDEDGVWIIQMSYLPSMLEANAFDNICHEHLEYYCLRSLWNLLKRFDLKIFDAQLDDVNGGSFRILVKHARCEKYAGTGLEHVMALEDHECRLQLDSLKTYQAFASRVMDQKKAICSFIQREVSRGKRVYAYGASTKGNTLLQYFGLDHTLILAAAERSSDKWGKQTVGTQIPILSEEQMRKEHPDYLLVLPWHFLREFIEREKAYLASGGKFIVPLPRFAILP